MKNNENTELKRRVVAWLHPNQIERMELLIQGEDMKNHTEFVAKAVDFYIGYLNSKDSTAYLSEHILGAINGTLKSTENRLAANLFRLSVEMSVMMNVLAEGMMMDDDWLRKTRARCVAEVKRSKGKITLEDAVEHQRESDA